MSCEKLGQEAAAAQAVQGDRVGKVVQGPETRDNEVQVRIRWGDDGEESGWIKASELGWIYPEVTIREEDFAARCRAQPTHTVTGNAHSSASSGWFEKLRLALVEERSCIADLCAACGL